MEDRWFPFESTRAESRSSDSVRRERLLEPGIYSITLLAGPQEVWVLR